MAESEMDEIVKLAMAKWPRVPNCYGWLALDARGNWRMRDERAQALQLPGEMIRHPALLSFINRNYGSDAQGNWFFQNGPQRVYVDLEITPFIVRTEPQSGLRWHTGQDILQVDQVWLTEQGRLLLQSGAQVGSLDDRDWITCLDQLSQNGQALSEEALTRWLEQPTIPLEWQWRAQTLTVQAIRESDIASRFGFQTRPQPDTAQKDPAPA
jgi:hypothetical protein